MFSGVYENLNPRPDYAVLGVAGQPCVNGFGYTGTTATFIGQCLSDLGWPKHVSWALHDAQLLDPKYIDTKAVDAEVAKRGEGKTKIVDLPVAGGAHRMFSK